jgi:hypothetical protein
MKKLFVIVALAMFVLSVPAFGAGLLEVNDQHMKGSWTFWRDITVKRNTTLEGNLTVSGTLAVSTNRSFRLPLAASFITGGGPVAADGTTAPGMAATDSVPALVWATGENSPVEWTFRVPADFSSGLGFRVLASSSAVDTPPEIDWSLTVNEDDTAFASALAQTAVSMGASCNVSNEEVTLTPDATAVSAIGAGDWVTLKIWNTDTGNGTLEVKGVEGLFTGTN